MKIKLLTDGQYGCPEIAGHTFVGRKYCEGCEIKGSKLRAVSNDPEEWDSEYYYYFVPEEYEVIKK